MNVVRWEEPAHGNTGKQRGAASRYGGMADVLRARPGQWAVIVENVPPGTAGALAHRIRTGESNAAFLPAGSFEARTVAPADGNASVYARYVGGES